jgi:putative methyltransferase (TIGR04325 family)
MRPEWEYVGSAFGGRVRGWDVAAVEEAYRRRWPEFLAAVRSGGTLGIAHEVPLGQSVVKDDPGWHNVVLTFGYVLARAARGRGEVSLLDWGGGPGHYYLIARELLPEVDLDYHSRDLPRLAALGRELLPAAHFHDNDECLERRYDLVMVSDSLQYVEDWRRQLTELARAAAPWLYVAMLPLASASFVIVQRPDAYGYETEYESWVLGRDEFLTAAAAVGLQLEREFVAPGVIDAAGAPEAAALRSFLFANRAS